MLLFSDFCIWYLIYLFRFLVSLCVLLCSDDADQASRLNNSTNPYGTLTQSSRAPYSKVLIFRGTQVTTRTRTHQPVISLQPNYQPERTTIWTDGIWWSILSTRHHLHSPRMLNIGLVLCLSMPRRNEGLILACWVKRILLYICLTMYRNTDHRLDSLFLLAFKNRTRPN
jgi:hypothetical protein